MKCKGSMISLVVMLVMLVGMAVVLPLSYRILDAGYEELQNMSGTTEQLTNDTMSGFMESVEGGLFDQAFIVLFVMLSVVMITLAYVSDNALPFLILYIIMSIIFVFISIPMSNIYQELMATPQYAMIPAGAFTMTTAFMSNLPAIMTVMAIIVGIVLFAKAKSDAGGVYY